MELFSSIAHSIISRNEPSYSDINENINKLITELGDRIEKDLVTIEERIILGFRDRLLSAQQEYRDLQKSRNQESIKENVLSLKNEQEKLFQQEELKSLEMNRLYDKIKVELKRNMEYEHELQLEAKFLAKQVAIAKKKAEILDQELREIQQPNLLASTQPLFQPFLLPKLTSPKPLMVTVESEEPDGLFQKRVKNKIETMKQYLELLSEEQSAIEKILGRLDLGICRSELQKQQMVDRLFRDRQFKQYLYRVLFRNKRLPSTKQQEPAQISQA